MSIKKEIGGNIRRLRQHRNWSQEALATQAGLNRSYVGAVERGEHDSGIVNVEKIAVALGVHLQDLFTPRCKPAVAPVVPADTQRPKVVAIHWPTFMQVLENCTGSPDAVKHYLEISGIEVMG